MFVFYLFLVLTIIVTLLFSIDDNGPAMTAVLLLGGLVLSVIAWVNPIPFVLANWPWILGGLAGYLLVGLCWAVFKWWRMVKYVASALMAIQQTFDRKKIDNGESVYPDANYTKEFEQFLERNHQILGFSPATWYGARNDQTYILYNFSGDFARWAVYWPFSFVTTFLHGFFVNLWTILNDIGIYLYEAASKTLQAILKRAFSDLK